MAGARARAEAPGADAAVHVDGAVNKPVDWTVAKLKEMFAGQLKQVEYTVKGQKHVSTCVPLLAIVQAAEPVTDPKHKNFAMRLAVVVRAADGYAATFGMGELMPDVGNRPAWIAIDMDGQPLSGREAPAKLIVPGDAKPTRAVWGVARIGVVDPTAGQTNDK
jgi:DMSO/TMAO reductase YedYZ molybdopterin-dependent catalytic subunit